MRRRERKMKKFNQFDLEKAEIINGKKYLPAGDWTAVKFKGENDLVFADDTYIGNECQIGNNCIIGSNCRIGNDFTSGRLTRVRPGCVFGNQPEFGNNSQLSDCKLGVSAKFGNNCSLDNCNIGALAMIGEKNTLYKCIVGEWSQIDARSIIRFCTILESCKIGKIVLIENSTIGALCKIGIHSVLTKNKIKGGTQISAAGRLEDCTIGANSAIGKYCVLRDCQCADHVRVDAETEILFSDFGNKAQIGDGCTVYESSLYSPEFGDNCTISDKTEIKGNCVVGKNSRIFGMNNAKIITICVGADTIQIVIGENATCFYVCGNIINESDFINQIDLEIGKNMRKSIVKFAHECGNKNKMEDQQ